MELPDVGGESTRSGVTGVGDKPGYHTSREA